MKKTIQDLDWSYKIIGTIILLWVVAGVISAASMDHLGVSEEELACTIDLIKDVPMGVSPKEAMSYFPSEEWYRMPDKEVEVLEIASSRTPYDEVRWVQREDDLLPDIAWMFFDDGRMMEISMTYQVRDFKSARKLYGMIVQSHTLFLGHPTSSEEDRTTWAKKHSTITFTKHYNRVAKNVECSR